MLRTLAAALPDADADATLRRELYFLSLFRTLEAALLALVLFSPLDILVVQAQHTLLGQATATVYLMLALVLLLGSGRGELRTQTLLGIGTDILAAALAMHALPGANAGIAMMLLFNVGAAALLLPLRLGLGAAALAGAALIGEYLWSLLVHGASFQPLSEVLMFTVSFMAMATLTNLLGLQMSASQAQAEHSELQAANMAEVSELVLRRLRTGVLLVDGDERVRLSNEAASLLLGDIDPSGSLATLSPELARRLRRWRLEDTTDDTPVRLATDLPEVVPRFSRLLAEGDHTLIFLDDISLLSRHAESITLATLGRFSASLAHEIRNPLAAINHAVQLLQESDPLPETDRRLLKIVHQQSQRMNGIIDNVLSLARRERAHPEHVELVAFAGRFIDEYRAGHPLEQDSLQLKAPQATVTAMADPQQLHQVLTTLVHNALLYGRTPDAPAQVKVHVYHDATHVPTLDVLDRGPGIPETVATQLFRPFFTTSTIGTGLGLYIARELCRANQASLEYIALPAGGSCFRVSLPGPHTLLP